MKISKDLESGEPDGKYPPQFNYKIVVRNGNCLCKFYDTDRNKIEIDEYKGNIEDVNLKGMLVKTTKIKALLKCNGIWISGNKFGCTWRAEQAIISVPEELEDFAFRDSDEEGGEDEFVESSDSE